MDGSPNDIVPLAMTVINAKTYKQQHNVSYHDVRVLQSAKTALNLVSKLNRRVELHSIEIVSHINLEVGMR